MVADAIASQPGVWFSDEPYAVFPGRAGYQTKLAKLPTANHSHFFDLTEDAAHQFDSFSRELLDAQFLRVP